MHFLLLIFADDTLIAVSADNIEEAVNKINYDLELISDWLKANKLKLNVNKTKSMIITLKKNIKINEYPVKIDNEVIEYVPEIKYLGVIIDNKLKFDLNMEYITKKVSKKYGMMCRLSKKLTTQCKITLYKSLVSPHIDYCSSILFSASDDQINELQKQQNKIMRLILKCNRYTRIKDMLEKLEWMSVKQRINYNTLTMIYKIENNLLPEYLSCKLVKNSSIHNYNTRTANKFRLPSFTKKVAQNTIFYNGLRLYNNMETNIKSAPNLKEFKKLCEEYVKRNF
jgi:Reverse transcriptase (RNA-dependent DNA polymerase)